MSNKESTIKARSLNIGKRERLYQGDTEIPQKMKFLDVSFSLLDYTLVLPCYLQRKWIKRLFNGKRESCMFSIQLLPNIERITKKIPKIWI